MLPTPEKMAWGQTESLALVDIATLYKRHYKHVYVQKEPRFRSQYLNLPTKWPILLLYVSLGSARVTNQTMDDIRRVRTQKIMPKFRCGHILN